jgi:hypothetical protein
MLRPLCVYWAYASGTEAQAEHTCKALVHMLSICIRNWCVCSAYASVFPFFHFFPLHLPPSLHRASDAPPAAMLSGLEGWGRVPPPHTPPQRIMYRFWQPRPKSRMASISETVSMVAEFGRQQWLYANFRGSDRTLRSRDRIFKFSQEMVKFCAAA